MNVQNIPCPFCGAPSFIFPFEGISKFLCHSCKRYSNYDFVSRFSKNNETTTEKKSIKVDYSSILNRANPINNLPKKHPAVEFISKRKIPQQYFSDLFFVENLKTFLHQTVYENVEDEFPKILIPLRSKNGLFGIQARSIDKKDKGPKYTTLKFVECSTIFGIDKIDISKPVIVVEGPFDSMFVENAIAVTGSGFTKIDFEADFVYCLDNEPRNRFIVETMGKLLKSNKKIVIWPEKIKEKDINDMILKGIDVNSVISENIFSGSKAIIKLSNWKKV